MPNSTVLRGSISCAGYYDGPENVALKVVWDEDIDSLRYEAELYKTSLAPLQGTVVPKFVGFYVGESESGTSLGCLVLEYCGSPLKETLRCQPMEFRCVSGFAGS